MIYYMGSKSRYAEEIITIATAGRPSQTWVEPFVGGGNIICRVPAIYQRIGSDVNWRMIKLLDAVGNHGWVPPDWVTKEEFEQIKAAPDDYPPELVAFVATGCTYGSLWFGPYTTSVSNNQRRPEYAKNLILSEAPGLRGVKFLALRYEELTPHIPPRSIIYCDPPYVGTAGYKGASTTIEVGQDLSLNTWNRGAFWKWADKLVDEGHHVFVSEYASPPSTIYGMTPELQSAGTALLKKGQVIDTNPKAFTRADREALRAELMAHNSAINSARERLAARWETLWEKEVVSDFYTERGGEKTKKNIEKLFHRRP